jgi:hypothetical protein
MQYTEFVDFCQEGAEKKCEITPATLPTLVAPLLSKSCEFVYKLTTPDGAEEIRWDDHDKGDPVNCPYSVPRHLQEPENELARIARPRVPPSKKYAALYAMMRNGQVDTAILYHTAIKYQASAPLLAYCVDPTTHKFVRASIRGDARDCKRTSDVIAGACAYLNQVPGTALFVTCSVDPAKVEQDLIAANQQILAEMGHYKKLISHGRKMHYVGVVEFQRNGRAHLHILLKFEDEFFTTFEDKHKKMRIENEHIRNMLKNCWNLGFCDVQAVADTKVANYLRKYLVKGFSDTIKNPAGLTGKELNEWKKQAMGLLFPIMLKVRRYWHSKIPEILEENSKEKRINELVQKINKTPVEKKNRKKFLDDLINSLNNFLSLCHSGAWLVSKPDSKTLFDPILDTTLPDDSDFFQLFKRKGIPLGCAGCILTRLQAYIYATCGPHLEHLENFVPFDPVLYRASGANTWS